MKRFSFSSVALLSFLILGFPVFSWAETGELACEIMSVEGKVELVKDDGTKTPLKDADVVKEGSVIETGDGSTDVSFDKDWNNVVRIEKESKVTVASLWPSRMELQKGAVFAKLKKLPKDSTFEIQTPTAVASVRGTEYRATFINNETQVYNFSPSQVFVYGVNAQGQKSEASTVLTQSQKTNISKAGEIPKPPQVMTASEVQEGESVQSALTEKVKIIVESGRTGKIQDVAVLEKSKPSPGGRNPKGESRVVDSRRRAFKSTS